MFSEDLLQDLARRLGGTLLGHAPLQGGVSSRIARLEIGLASGETRSVVLRSPGPPWKAHDPALAPREHALLLWLHSRGLPVPRPLLLDRDHACYVMEHVEGSTDPQDLDDALEQMAETLARLHALPLEQAPALPAREDPVAWLLEHLPEDQGALRAALARAPAREARRTLVHGDFWPGNLLWRDGRLLAVLDWEDVAVGDPVSDLACCHLELRYKHGLEIADRFLERYAARAAVDRDGLALWQALVSTAALDAMALWGLEPSLEAHMRREAEAERREAAARVLGWSGLSPGHLIDNR